MTSPATMFLSENNEKQGSPMRRINGNCKTGKEKTDIVGDVDAPFFTANSLVESIQMLGPLGL